MNNEDGSSDYGLDDCLNILRPAAARALSLTIEGIDDPKITAARRLINTQNVLNMWLRTETLHNQRMRLTEPLKRSSDHSEQAAAPVVFQLHQHQEK